MTETTIQPYIFFGGRCDEALEFYRTAIGAETTFRMRFQESPTPPPPGVLPPGFENKIMHASFRVGTTEIYASDGCTVGETYQGFSLAIGVSTEAEADRIFAGLAEGGQIKMPLSKTFWSPKYGMVVDRFGVNWMVMVRAEQPQSADGIK